MLERKVTMKKIILLISLSFLITNCKSGGGDSTSNTSDRDILIYETDLSKWGPSAKLMLEAYPRLQAFFDSTDPSLPDEEYGSHQNLFYAMMGYVNALTKRIESNNQYDLGSVDNETAVRDLLVDAQAGDAGLRSDQLCIILSGIYEDMGIETDLIYIEAQVSNYLPSGEHCLVQAWFHDKFVILDPVYAAMYDYELAVGVDEDNISNYTGSIPGIDANEFLRMHQQLLQEDNLFVTSSAVGQENNIHHIENNVGYTTFYHYIKEVTGNQYESYYKKEHSTAIAKTINEIEIID